MKPLLLLALPVCVFLATRWLTGRFRLYALARQLLDVPNVRSSHLVATPRGGGIMMVLTTLTAVAVAASSGLLAAPIAWAIVGGGALVGAVGFVDDHHHLARRWRLLAHVAAAAWVLAWLGGLPPVPIMGTVVRLGWVGHGLAAGYLVWLINLTNFMDGIDGIAATESATVSIGGVVLYLAVASGIPGDPVNFDWVAPLLLAAASLAFLTWNWPPAKIFMGDAGSTFLGLMLGLFPLLAARTVPALLWPWIILLGVFIVDATITLGRRAIRGDRVYEAHRLHAYQQAARHLGSHKRVAVAVAVINLAWLMPLALLVARGSMRDLVGVGAAYVPLAALALWWKAGIPEQPSGIINR